MSKQKISSAKFLPHWQHISTGCLSLDAILKGGVPVSGGITEIFGCSGVGKTQISLQLALMAQLPTHLGGLEKSVIYICADDIFPIKRLIELSEHFTQKYKEHVRVPFEDNIFIEHVADIEQLKKCLSFNLPKLLQYKKVGLIIIDSIAGVFRSENLDVNYTNRSQDFIAIVTMLNEFSRKHNLAVVCINQVTDNIETGKTEPCLGLAWSNLITHRLGISRSFKSPVREFEVIFAPDLPNKSCQFMISKEGIIGL